MVKQGDRTAGDLMKLRGRGVLLSGLMIAAQVFHVFWFLNLQGTDLEYMIIGSLIVSLFLVGQFNGFLLAGMFAGRGKVVVAKDVVSADVWPPIK